MPRKGPFVVVNCNDVQGAYLSKGALSKRLINRASGSPNLAVGLGYLDAGKPYHGWHRHQATIKIDKLPGKGMTKEAASQLRVTWDEVYYVIKGSGVIEWLDEDGKRHEFQVREGDAIFLSGKSPYHQLRNTGKEQIHFLYALTPPTS